MTAPRTPSATRQRRYRANGAPVAITLRGGAEIAALRAACAAYGGPTRAIGAALVAWHAANGDPEVPAPAPEPVPESAQRRPRGRDRAGY